MAPQNKPFFYYHRIKKCAFLTPVELAAEIQVQNSQKVNTIKEMLHQVLTKTASHDLQAVNQVHHVATTTTQI